jgi:hypothetical protein
MHRELVADARGPHDARAPRRRAGPPRCARSPPARGSHDAQRVPRRARVPTLGSNLVPDGRAPTMRSMCAFIVDTWPPPRCAAASRRRANSDGAQQSRRLIRGLRRCAATSPPTRGLARCAATSSRMRGLRRCAATSSSMRGLPRCAASSSSMRDLPRCAASSSPTRDFPDDAQGARPGCAASDDAQQLRRRRAGSHRCAASLFLDLRAPHARTSNHEITCGARRLMEMREPERHSASLVGGVSSEARRPRVGQSMLRTRRADSDVVEREVVTGQ